MKNKIFLLMIISIFIFINMSIVSSEFWACFGQGEEYSFCNPLTNYYRCNNYDGCTCDSSSGCNFCMKTYNETRNCYNQGNWNVCQTIPQECFDIGDNTSIDQEPPIINISSPANNYNSPSRAVDFDIDIDELSNLYYLDSANERYGFRKICNGCTKFKNEISFDDGPHNVTFRAVDSNGNEGFEGISIFVDSKKPKIRNTIPKNKEYVNTVFIVNYDEVNLKNITLNYLESGASGYVSEARTDCPAGLKQACSFEKNGLAQGPLYYYFSVCDSASCVDSKQALVFVDTIDPVINVFSPKNIVYDSRRVLINLSVSEDVKLEYIDYAATRPRYNRLCSNCDGYARTKSFSYGNHDLTFRATDKAGNVGYAYIQFSNSP